MFALHSTRSQDADFCAMLRQRLSIKPLGGDKVQDLGGKDVRQPKQIVDRAKRAIKP